MKRKPKMVTEKRWAILDASRSWTVFHRWVTRLDAEQTQQRWDGLHPLSAPHRVVRVTLTYREAP